jgi:ferredoxin-NADP reductase
MTSPDQSPLPPALPGQFLVTRVRPAPDGLAILRNYSLSGAPDEGVYRISVKREVNGVGSTFLHTRLKAGHSIEVSAPRGNFSLQPGDGPVVLLGAGIGVTPLLSMLHRLNSQVSNREVWWLYGARNRDEHPLAEEARRLLAGLANSRRLIAYSKPGSGDITEDHFHVAGHLDIATLEQLGVPKESDFYLCGPASFLSTFLTGLREWGVEPQRSIAKRFTPSVISAPRKLSGLARPPQGTGPQIGFVRSGVTVPWDEQFSSLLELAEAHDIPVRWSCRTGVCHT